MKLFRLRNNVVRDTVCRMCSLLRRRNTSLEVIVSIAQMTPELSIIKSYSNHSTKMPQLKHLSSSPIIAVSLIPLKEMGLATVDDCET